MTIFPAFQASTGDASRIASTVLIGVWHPGLWRSFQHVRPLRHCRGVFELLEGRRIRGSGAVGMRRARSVFWLLRGRGVYHGGAVEAATAVAVGCKDDEAVVQDRGCRENVFLESCTGMLIDLAACSREVVLVRRWFDRWSVGVYHNGPLRREKEGPRVC